MRFKARIDDNQNRIVAVLRKMGCMVLSLAAVGRGVPDLLVLHHGLHLIEIKDGSKPPSARKLTPDQKRFHALWPVEIMESEDDALQFVNRLNK